MPVEIMARRGADTLRYGPLRPVGLINPATGHRPWANVQLRSEDKENSRYNLVGFQTNLKFGEQKRVFSMIPGLENAEFVRYGVMHRNSFLNSPRCWRRTCRWCDRRLLCRSDHRGRRLYGERGLRPDGGPSGAAPAAGQPPLVLPPETMCGALMAHVTTETADFQPMGSNMGLLPPLPERVRDKRLRYEQMAERAVAAMQALAQADGL